MHTNASVSLFHWPIAANSCQKLPKAAKIGYKSSHHGIYWQLLAAIGRMLPKAANCLPIAAFGGVCQGLPRGCAERKHAAIVFICVANACYNTSTAGNPQRDSAAAANHTQGSAPDSASDGAQVTHQRTRTGPTICGDSDWSCCTPQSRRRTLTPPTATHACTHLEGAA
jgi:hypothetical protein